MEELALQRLKYLLHNLLRGELHFSVLLFGYLSDELLELERADGEPEFLLLYQARFYMELV